MVRFAMLSLVADGRLAAAVDGVAEHLAGCGFDLVPDPREANTLLVWSDRPLTDDMAGRLLATGEAGGRVLLCGPTLAASAERTGLLDAAGVIAGARTPLHPVRVRPQPGVGDFAARFEPEIDLVDSWLRVEKVADDVDVLATAMFGLAEHPVLTWRAGCGLGFLSVGSTAEVVTAPAYRRLVQRWVRHAAGLRDAPPTRIGLLGFGAIGAEHAAAIGAVDGLRLAAVCDQNPARVEAARALAPDLTVAAEATDLLADDGVDLVVVSTPPSTHAQWALRALEAGKHVVVEKPFCLTTAEADAMLAAAAAADRVLAVYQNRRWDADYLALKQIVRSGAIGEVFHYESFVGSYGHPCNYWHSDEEVSGGAIYDWGSHYLDWVLDLLPQDVLHVTAAAHKRVWHDVTNADHSRVTIRFADGAEAEFVHSDLAAAMKPKWYVLGTAGAVVGHWRHERVVARSAIGTLVEDSLAASESPATLSVHGADGSVTHVAIPPAVRHPFHRELADRLVAGAPMSVTPTGSRRNIAVMEAAVASAREAGRPVTPQ